MKQKLSVLFSVIGIVLSLYLAGSFANASFNIKEWDSFYRGIVSFIGGAVLVFGFVGLIVIDKKD